MRSHRSNGDREFREAQEWSRKLPTADEATRREFAKWSLSSTGNLKAFLLITVLDTGIPGGTVSEQNRGRPSRVGLTGNGRIGRVIQFPRSHLRPGRDPEDHTSSRTTLRWLAVAATVIASLLVAQFVPLRFGQAIDKEFSTNIGERHTFELADGTSLQLNTNSRVRVHYTARRRDISLEQGEIYVNVAKDRRRPLRVQTDRVEIQDVGTIFTVRKAPDETTVYVLKGRVRLTAVSPSVPAKTGMTAEDSLPPSLEIGGGDEAVIKTSDNGAPSTFTARAVTPEESDKRIAWTRGVLIFRDDLLRDVIREVNRYQRRPITIVDPGLETRHIGGRIDPATDEYKMVLRAALSTSCPVIIDESDPSVIQLRIDNRVDKGIECRLGG